MLIETQRGVYRVIRVLREELSLRVYLAVDPDRREKGELRCLMLEFLNPVLGKEMMLYLTEFGEGRRAKHGKESLTGMESDTGKAYAAWEGFRLAHCFVRRGTVWAVFPYHEGRPFHEAARRAGSVRERLLLWEGLLERLFYDQMPDYMRYEAAAPGNLIVDEKSAVWVNYELFETDRRHEELFPELQKRLYEYFHILFVDETACGGRRAGKDPVLEYAGRLKAGAFENEILLCREFYGLRALLAKREEEKAKREKRIPIRIWKAVFGHADRIWKCGYWLLVLALWAGFVFLCFRQKSVPEQRMRITAVGTLKIDGQAEEANRTGAVDVRTEDVNRTGAAGVSAEKIKRSGESSAQKGAQ